MAEEKTIETCCGGPAPEESQACCIQDAEAKAAGEAGCGCGTAQPAKEGRAAACCG